MGPMSATGQRRMRTGDWGVVIAPALLGALVCLPALAGRSLWLDEGATVSIVSQHGAALWRGIAHDGGNMLVYYLALHVIVGLFGDGTVPLRGLSVLADALSAGLVAALALRLFGGRCAALVSGVLCALSVSLVFWGQDARGYALMVTAAAAAFLALVGVVDSDPGTPVPRGALLGYGLATLLSLYIGFDAVLLIPAELLCAWVLRRGLRELIAVLLLVALACLPLVLLALQRGSSQLFWVGPLSLSALGQTLVTVLSAGLPPNFHVTVVTVIATVWAGVLVLVATALALADAWPRLAVRRPRSDHSPAAGALVIVPTAWWLLTALLTVAGSAAGEPFELARISILVIPAVSLLLGWLLTGAGQNLRAATAPARTGHPPGTRLPHTRGVAATLLVILLGLRVAVLLPSYAETPEPWKQVAARVLAARQPGDCVAFYPEDGRMPFAYYVQHTPGGSARAPRAVLPVAAWSARTPHVEEYVVPSPRRLGDWLTGCRRLWLIASHQGSAHGTPTSVHNAAGYRLLEAVLSRAYLAHRASAEGYAAVIHITLYARPAAARRAGSA